jgi:coenzyme F420-reducing hydrogenase beta subunit
MKRLAASALAFAANPIDPSGWPERFPAKEHCSRCGLCETTYVKNVNDACAFLGPGMGRIDELEVKVHGRGRKLNDMAWSDAGGDNIGSADEGRFGVLKRPIMLAKGIENEAQWTGVVTGIAVSMLESNMVDAVVCIGGGDDWSEPEPIIARTVESVLCGRGVKPALAPSLRVLDEIKADPSIRRLLFCGVGCAVQAFRSIEDELGLEEAFVLGTNCADNSPTPKAARNFLSKGVGVDEGTVKGYEFMQDFKVHVKTEAGYEKKPYFCLPGEIAQDAIATSCLACFDYTNALADVVIGYMGAPLDGASKMDESYQTLTIRNARGASMVAATEDSGRLNIGDVAGGTGSHEKIAMATVLADSIVLAMTGGEVKKEGMPRLLGEVLAFIMTTAGPKGINFARYSIDYHLLRNYLHVLDAWGEERAERSLPKYATEIVNKYMERNQKLVELKETIRNRQQVS